MRKRNLHQQNKDSIISQSGVYDLSDVQPYLQAEEINDEELTSTGAPKDIKKALAVDNIYIMKSSGAFSYQKQDSIEPK